MIKEGKYGATGLNDPDLVGRTAVDVGLKARRRASSRRTSRSSTDTKPDVITKDNVDKYYRKPNAVF